MIRYSTMPTAAVLALGLSACTANVETPYATPTIFDASDYCNTAVRDAPLIIPQRILTLLEDDTVEASPEDLVQAMMERAAMEISHSSADREVCDLIFKEGEGKFLGVLKAQRDSFADKGSFRPSKDETLFTIQKDITRLWREDQSGRFTFLSLRTDDTLGSDYWAHRLSIAHSKSNDASSKDYMEELLDRYDWIDIDRFTESVSAHAWILVQHADDHPDFQAKVLARMEPYLESGGILKANYAYLWDRVAINTGRKQLYGTQPTWECNEDGKLTLHPLEAPETVDERRAELGMDTVEEGLARMAQGVCS